MEAVTPQLCQILGLLTEQIQGLEFKIKGEASTTDTVADLYAQRRFAKEIVSRIKERVK